MQVELSAPEQTLVGVAEDFAGELHTEHADALRDDRPLPAAAFQAAARCGLVSIEVPGEHGGGGHGFVCKMRVAERLARVSMAFAFSLVNTHNAANKLARCGTAQAVSLHLPDLLRCERFGATALTEPHAGSDFSAIRTTARRTGNAWVLNGEKAWITNAAFADLFITYAQTDAMLGWRGIACFLVDATATGFERAAPFDLYGGNGIGTGGFALRQVEVPDSHLIHPAGEAFKAALGSINGARTYVAAMCCAMVEAALDTAVTYGKGRQSFGSPLLAHQGLRWQLADVATELAAARGLTERAAALVQAGAPGAVLAAAHAKKFAARMAEPAISACIQSMGANGLRAEHGLGHHLACARIANYVDGSTEMMNERIAALLLDA